HDDRSRIAGLGGGEQRLRRRYVAHGRPRGGERGTRRDRLQAAALAALAQRAGGVNRDVPDLSGRTVVAPSEPALEYQPGRQTGADADVDQVVLAAQL